MGDPTKRENLLQITQVLHIMCVRLPIFGTRFARGTALWHRREVGNGLLRPHRGSRALQLERGLRHRTGRLAVMMAEKIHVQGRSDWAGWVYPPTHTHPHPPCWNPANLERERRDGEFGTAAGDQVMTVKGTEAVVDSKSVCLKLVLRSSLQTSWVDAQQVFLLLHPRQGFVFQRKTGQVAHGSTCWGPSQPSTKGLAVPGSAWQ